MWEVRIQHEGLRASRVLHGATQADAQWKATLQLRRWEARWSALQRRDAARNELVTRQWLALHGRSTAARFTRELGVLRLALESILASSLERGRFLHWDLLKDTATFSDPPVVPEAPRTPAPQLVKEVYAPQLTLLDKLVQSRRASKELAASEDFARDLIAWQMACRERNRMDAETYALRRGERQQRAERQRDAQLAQHAKVLEAKGAFEAHEKDAVEYFFAEVLSRSTYPAGFPEDVTVQYARSKRTLVVEYELPSIAAWPTQQAVRYDAARNTLEAVPAAETWRRRSYKSGLFQIALRVLRELFAHDDVRSLERVAFNGWVRSVDASTGNMAHACVLSIAVSRSAFAEVNLAMVEPAACFRRLKGVASANLMELRPVRPVMALSRSGEHFLNLHDGGEEVDGVNEGGGMSRSDVETLVREMFEREFRKNRSQVGMLAATREVGRDATV
jgi:restriction system protein